MPQPNTRAEFERNVYLLHRKFELKEIHISPHLLHSLEGLEHVRRLPNGRVDFLSVDESARLQANMIANMSQMPRPTPTEPKPGRVKADQDSPSDKAESSG